MKGQTFVLLGMVAVLLIASVGVRAEEVEVGVTGKMEVTGPAGELRGQIKTERKTLIEENQDSRKALREEEKTEREKLNEENKLEREKFKKDSKKLLEGKTPEEKAQIMVTIKANRKAMIEKNQAERQEFRKVQWDKRKSMIVNIRANVDALRESARVRWEALWASFKK